MLLQILPGHFAGALRRDAQPLRLLRQPQRLFRPAAEAALQLGEVLERDSLTLSKERKDLNESYINIYINTYISLYKVKKYKHVYKYNYVI